MSDTLIIAVSIIVVIFVIVVIFLIRYRDPITDRIRSGSSIDAKAKLPAGFEVQFTLGNPPPLQLSEKEKAELEQASKQWNKHKTGNIYWLASDLILAINIAKQNEPKDVTHFVRQTYWHTSQLKLGEPIEERFARLCKKTNSFTKNDWNNPERRGEISNELAGLFHAIAFIMTSEDKEFQGSPTPEWEKC